MPSNKLKLNKITNDHTIAVCNDKSINMVPLPPAELPELNTFGTLVRLSLSQNQMDPPNNTHT